MAIKNIKKFGIKKTDIKGIRIVKNHKNVAFTFKGIKPLKPFNT